MAMDEELRMRLDGIESLLHRLVLDVEAAKKAAEAAEVATRSLSSDGGGMTKG
jgi:hypothetical protein